MASRGYRAKLDVLDEALKTRDKVGKAEAVKGADVSVPEDAGKEDEVSDGAPSVRSGIRPERDTLGNTSSIALRIEVTAAGRAGSVGST